MTVYEIRQRRDAALAESQALIEKRESSRLSKAEQTRLDALAAETHELEVEEARLEERRRTLQQGVESGRYVTEDVAGNVYRAGRKIQDGPYAPRRSPGFTGDPFHDPGRESPEQTRSRARAAVESWDADDELKQGAIRTLESAGQLAADDGQAMRDVEGVARHIITFSSPDYVAAFRKFARSPEDYQADLTRNEAEAWRRARHEARATLDLTGAVLPAPLDPTIVLTNDGTIDPMRGIARVDSTVSNEKRYVTSAGSTFSFDAELAEVSDDTPTLGEPKITVHKAQGWIEASIEAAMDQPDFSSEVAKIIADGKANLEGAKFVKGAGDGSNEPFGIETRLAAGAATSVVDPATAETFAAADVFALIQAVPPRFRGRARWLAELSTINAIQQMETSNGAPLFPGVDSANPRLLRRGLAENSNVDPASGIDPTATADNFILYAGDFRNYVILDRVGLSVHFIPPGVLKGASGRPDGRVGWYAFWRVGADALDVAAFRVLNVATTA